MDKDTVQIITRFRNLSSKIAGMIYDDFRRDAKSLDRQTDENVFQKLQGRYMKELEKQLHRAAEGLVEEHTGDRDIGTLQHELARQISYLLSEFLVKAKSM